MEGGLISNPKAKKTKKKFYFFIFFGLLAILSWGAWRLLIVAESSIGFTNHGTSRVSIYKIILDGQSIYAGPSRHHDPGVKTSEHGHYFGFSKPMGKLSMRVYFTDGEGHRRTATYELDHGAGRYIFWCAIDNHYVLSCVLDDIFDFGH